MSELTTRIGTPRVSQILNTGTRLTDASSAPFATLTSIGDDIVGDQP